MFKISIKLQETQDLLKKLNFQMTSKMFLDIVGVITTTKLGILKTSYVNKNARV